MTGSDILPPLAHSTNPLFPNAIVKKPPTNAKYMTRAPKAPAEEKEAKKPASISSLPPAAPKPYVGKNGPVSSYQSHCYGSELTADNRAGAVYEIETEYCCQRCGP
jgi:hypothetical protein